MSSGTIPDLAVVAAAADMIGGWHDDVFAAINMTEARILADLFDELGHTGTADHKIKKSTEEILNLHSDIYLDQ